MNAYYAPGTEGQGCDRDKSSTKPATWSVRTPCENDHCQIPVKMLGVGLRKGPRGQDQASRLREARPGYPQNKVSH